MTTTLERPETAYEQEVRRAREHFTASVGDHQMTVLLDTLDDHTPYRHVRFAAPDTAIWSWNLVTWPGHLSISGDIGGFTFRRLHDMFAFFRGGRDINPQYWGEKTVAGPPRTEYGRSRFSDERYVESVRDHLSWAEDDYTSAEFAQLKAAAHAELLDELPTCYEEAYERLDSFSWTPAPIRPEDLTNSRPFHFSDVWEWNLGGYDHHFLISCYAIQWGVNKYLAEFPDRFIPEGGRRVLTVASL